MQILDTGNLPIIQIVLDLSFLSDGIIRLDGDDYLNEKMIVCVSVSGVSQWIKWTAFGGLFEFDRLVFLGQWD